jgi:hypothetical protein
MSETTSGGLDLDSLGTRNTNRFNTTFNGSDDPPDSIEEFR